jgi:hypothetical protein
VIDAILLGSKKTMDLIVDRRVNPLHAIRTEGSRRKSKILFHLHKLPLKDSDGNLIFINRRSGYDRRFF